MTYELAKKLKDAGWQVRASAWTFYGENMTESVPAPTLSELIDACGDEFFELIRDKSEFGPGISWIAMHNKSGTAYGGRTHEEAVAKLWLTLNKQDT